MTDFRSLGVSEAVAGVLAGRGIETPFQIQALVIPEALRGLAAMVHPVLYPGVGQLLRITQTELGYVVGLSRQRVNESLAALEAQGAIRVEYGGLRVLDLQALRSSVAARVA